MLAQQTAKRQLNSIITQQHIDSYLRSSDEIYAIAVDFNFNPLDLLKSGKAKREAFSGDRFNSHYNTVLYYGTL